jgi:Sec-independent protein translocase protein TatA
MLNFIKNISPIEWGIIIFILVLLFGGKFIANLGKRSGETVREIKKVKDEFHNAVNGEDESDNDK